MIAVAKTAADYAAFGDLCGRYVAWCRARYADMPWFVAEVFGHQALEAELADLPTKYGPPAGVTMLARLDGVVVAGGAYRRQSDTVCELKRLYVGDEARGTGLGRTLSQALFDAAKAEGFAKMRLDTGDRMTEAQALYAALGFKRIAPYLDYPARLQPHLVFMEKPL